MKNKKNILFIIILLGFITFCSNNNSVDTSNRDNINIKDKKEVQENTITYKSPTPKDETNTKTNVINSDGQKQKNKTNVLDENKSKETTKKDKNQTNIQNSKLKNETNENETTKDNKKEISNKSMTNDNNKDNKIIDVNIESDKVNNKVGEFILRDIYGKTTHISKYTGYITDPNLVVFIPFILDDPDLDRKIQIANTLYDSFQKQHINIVMLVKGRESSIKIRGLVSKKGIKCEILMDKNEEVFSKLSNNNNKLTKHVYLMDINRNIRYIYNIDDIDNAVSLSQDIINKSKKLLNEEAGKNKIPIDTVDFVVMSNPYASFTACGCPSQPYGGLSRYAYLLDEYRREYIQEPVSVLNGNILGEKPVPDFHKHFLRSINDLNLSAIIAGETDFVEGYKYLKPFNLPYTAVNISSKYLNWTKYRIVESNNKKICIVGVVPEDTRQRFSYLPSDLISQNIYDDINNTISSINEDYDILVLSIHVSSYKEMNKLNRKVEGVDLIINSGSEGLSLDPAGVNFYDPPMIELGTKGEFVNIVSIKITGNEIKAVKLKNTLLDDNVVEHPIMLTHMYRWQREAN